LGSIVAVVLDVGVLLVVAVVDVGVVLIVLLFRIVRLLGVVVVVGLTKAVVVENVVDRAVTFDLIA